MRASLDSGWMSDCQMSETEVDNTVTTSSVGETKTGIAAHKSNFFNFLMYVVTEEKEDVCRVLLYVEFYFL